MTYRLYLPCYLLMIKLKGKIVFDNSKKKILTKRADSFSAHIDKYFESCIKINNMIFFHKITMGEAAS